MLLLINLLLFTVLILSPFIVLMLWYTVRETKPKRKQRLSSMSVEELEALIDRAVEKRVAEALRELEAARPSGSRMYDNYFRSDPDDGRHSNGHGDH